MLKQDSSKHIKDFPASTLYLEDLVEIIDTFAQVCKKVEVSAGEFKISDPSELTTLAEKFTNDRFSDIRIQGYDPFVVFNTGPYNANAYISKDSIEQSGLISKVREVLHRHRKIRPDLVVDFIFYPVAMFGVWKILDKSYLLGVPLVLAAFLALLPVSLRLRKSNTVVVYSKNRNQMNSFFQRKKDDILLAFISAALGAAVSYAVTKLLP
jgi:hypothetical protein